MKPSSAEARAARATESTRTAGEAVGPVRKGMAVFIVTRGQWSMLDAAEHILRSLGQSYLSLWTWRLGVHDVYRLAEMKREGVITGGQLITDRAALSIDNARGGSGVMDAWRAAFGSKSIRFVMNHAKMARFRSSSGLHVLMRGSPNMNYNRRFENLDISEGGEPPELVERMEAELSVAEGSRLAVVAATNAGLRHKLGDFQPFQGARTWVR